MEKRQVCRRFLSAMAICFLPLPILVILIPGIHQKASTFDVIGRLYKPHPVGERVQNLHGLSSDLGFDGKSCLSRLQSRRYRKSGTQRKPSAYLLSKLRSYEALHRRCGPYTESYNRTVQLIGSGNLSTFSSTNCTYLVWHPVHGIGNRIVSLASTFLYALLTDRVLLTDLGEDMAGLFCEPFRGSSWVLPLEFPLKNLFRRNAFRFAHSVGSALKNGTLKVTEDSPEAPPFLFLNLYKGIYADSDYCFYCDESQSFLSRVPWLIMLSDQYFMPSFFLIPSFKQEAIKLFPEKEAVFFHLVHYLVHPSNRVWELITRFYEANLASANERIGLQVRLFKAQFRTSTVFTDQILACLLNQTLLPEIDNRSPELSSTSPGNQTTKAVLITSLYPQFYQNLSTMYSNKPTASGEVIRFYQPSHEEKQKFGDSEHNMKALVEIYLLSMCDKLVISSKSTFGYVAQGLGDTRAWMLRRPGHGTNDPCVRDLSTDPCFHYPPFRNCNAAGNNKSSYVDVAEHVSYLKHCEDQNRGVKLVDVHEEL
ncbi:unnamed protein product [Linum trigynum]|uniref:Fucosyltransferase n=1 Tax=Linum trigynum TaxID=586398 RepID=A0AAV2DUA7_9ROSI